MIKNENDNITEHKFLPNNFEEGAEWAQEQLGIALLSKWDCQNMTAQKYEDLIARIYKIYEANPWLTAMIKKGPSIKNASHTRAGTLSMLISEKRANASMSTKNLENSDCPFIVQEVRPGFFDKDLLGQMKEANDSVVKAVKDHLANPLKIPMSKFTVIRDNDSIEATKRITIVVSINHILGDGGTLYQVYNMLSFDKNPVALQRDRIPHAKELSEKTACVTKDGGDFLEGFFGAHMMPFLKKSIHRARVNYDGRYDSHNWMYKLNQAEIQKIKDQHSASDNCPFISTNDIITSWLFKFNKKADHVVVAADLRERLDSLKSCNRNGINGGAPYLAGNYIVAPFLRHDDLQSPENVRMALADVFDKKTNGEGYLEMPTGRQLMKYNTGMNTNWCKFYQSVKIPGMRLNMCCPHFDWKVEKYMGVIPCMEEGVIVFKMNDDDVGLFIMSGSGRITTEKLEASGILGEALMPMVQLWPEDLLAKRKNPPKMPFFNCFYPKIAKEDL